MKEIGILAPLFTLPNKYGIGDFSKSTFEFIDHIKSIGFKYWQILPLNPLGKGNSPYQSISSFALDDIYVSIEDLKERKLIKTIEEYPNDEEYIQYDKVREYKIKYLNEAFNNFSNMDNYEDILNEFIKKNKWVKEYATYIVLNYINVGQRWNKWDLNELSGIEKNVNFQFEVFIQYILDQQWNKIHKYANKKGIKMIGDLPFYVGYDSADCYYNKLSFLLNNDNSPILVAGVPPDYFSSDGQLWGNPIYDWKYLKENKYKLIIERIMRSLSIYDVLRLDHFRAFDTYYVIDAHAYSAKHGQWVEAPGYDFFDYLLTNYKNVNIIAEDLGNMRNEVYTLRDHYKFPGMEVIQFTLIDEEINHHFVKEIYKRENTIFYSGTHDNDSLLHWYNTLNSNDKNNIDNFLKSKNYTNKDITYKLFNYILDEPANTAIFSIIDILRIENHRFNEPGTMNEKNWSYRLKDYNRLLSYKDEMKELINKYSKK